MKPILHPRNAIELFHCHFLTELEKALAPKAYAIKGGCNLRMLLGSPRASEDLDLDIQQVAKHTLQKNVEKIIESTLKKRLTRYNVTIKDVSCPKQTDTVQRWKITLNLLQEDIPTKIEFSRRGIKSPTKRTLLPKNFQTDYQVAGIALSHYGPEAALKQKISALAGRTITQARDVFDAAFLLGINTSLPTSTEESVLKAAEDNVIALTFHDFQSQVIPYLEDDHAQNFNKPAVWEKLQNDVLNLLTRMPVGRTERQNNPPLQ